MFEWIMTSSALILIVAALRALLKGRIRLRLQYALWGLVLLRLLIPVNLFSSGMSILNTAPETAVSQVQTQISEPITYVGYHLPDLPAPEHTPDWTPGQADPQYDAAVVSYQARLETAKAETGRPITLEGILKALWLTGVAIVSALLLVSNLLFAAILRRSRRRISVSGCTLPLYVSKAVETPCLFGLLRPAIYLTPAAAHDPQLLTHVLAHEQTHCRHGDHIWSALRCVCLALHWYNPLVWLAARLSRKDAELACDEATIASLGERQRAAYGRTLIQMTCAKNRSEGLLLTATTMVGSKKEIKERIHLIAKRPMTALYSLISLILVAAIAVGCTFTGPATDPTEPPAGTQSPSRTDTQPSTAPGASAPEASTPESSAPASTPAPAAPASGQPAATQPAAPVQTTAHEPYFYPFMDEELAQAAAVARQRAQANSSLDGYFYYRVEKVAYDPLLTDQLVQRQILSNPQSGWTERDYYAHYITFAVTYSSEYAETPDGLIDSCEHAVGYVECFRADESSPWETVTYEGKAAIGSANAMSQEELDLGSAYDALIGGYCYGLDKCRLYLRDSDGKGVTVLVTDYSAFLPSGARLTDGELADYQSLFSWTPENRWYNLALTSAYSIPENVDLSYLFYNEITESTEDTPGLTQEELDFVENDPNVGSPNVSAVQKFPVSEMDKVLQQYFGLTVAQTNGFGLDRMAYNSATDSYYSVHGDYLVCNLTMRLGIAGSDGVIYLYYASYEPTLWCVALTPSGSGYHILSNTLTPLPG